MTTNSAFPESHTTASLLTTAVDSPSSSYCITRLYPNNAEAVVLRVDDVTVFKRGGGAKRKNDDKSEMSVKALVNSRQRIKSTVRQLALASDFDNLLTLTFRENVDDFDIAWRCFSRFRRLMKARYNSRFVYIAVPELQARGCIHFHLAIKGYFGHEFVRRAWLTSIAPESLTGNIDFKSRVVRGGRMKKWNSSSLAAYLAKYLTKSDIVGLNKRRYSRSEQLPLPQVVTCFASPGLDVPRCFRDLFFEMFGLPVRVLFSPDDRPGFHFIST